MKQLTACPICSSNHITFSFEAPTTRGQDKILWRVFKCADCGHQFMNPQPSWDELQPYYNNGYDPYDPNHGSRESDDSAVAEAQRTGKLRHISIPTGKRLLDVGCGAGYFLRIAKRLGAVEQGVEPSKYAASVASQQGLNVFCGTVEDFAKQTDKRFDVITSSHVIEHVPDPVATLSAMRSLLAPDGMIWIGVPNAAYPISKSLNGRWHSSDLPYHLMHFSPESMARAGELAGLLVRRQETESIPFIVEHSIGQYLRHHWKVPRRLSLGTGALRGIAKWYATRSDSMKQGEAILTEFVVA
ncbi:class I SAM-dependent methyltransferase [Bradyrhizobium sp. GCM10023182]|uniref:Class I SAM-dependent methyltransferase n=1 Tax=Bradyrhizobium zhengyangense TaxID=2911009 RepID=A0ABS9M307_9BRAD|nr:class I SAM-dependent methyltransferase [Bradyrhizobium zhengyangense]MCG2673302.1 class I SAM-dependent methyltransferase [Bradyrhizobium zhengyangense]